MLANHFGYDTVGSDIEIKQSEKNMSRRSTQAYASKHPYELYTQDATIPSNTSIELRPIASSADTMVVTYRYQEHIIGENERIPRTDRKTVYTSYAHYLYII